MNEELDKINALHDYFTVSADEIENLEEYYPLIKETVVPLSFTGVNAKTFHSWKQNGLVDLTILKKTDDTGRVWIKLNLYEYVWIKIIQFMRDFGLPYEVIKIMKVEMESKIHEQLLSGLEAAENYWRNELQYNEEKIQALKESYHKTANAMFMAFDPKDPYEQEKTVLFGFIKTIIVQQSMVSIILVKQKDNFLIDAIFYESPQGLAKLNYANIKRPRFEIPVKAIIEEFFEEPKSEEYGLQLGLFNAKEKRVLDALRQRDFLELIIKLNGEDDFIIEATSEGSITNEQAAYIRKTLGLGSYDSITLKHRNNKNLYFKKTRRI
ncbi:MAG: hypothetical protein V4538_13935 [Bacteroidota bacterium]